MTAAPHSVRALQFIKREKLITIDMLAAHMDVDRRKASRVLKNLVYSNSVTFVWPRSPGTYRLAQPGDVSRHRKSRVVRTETALTRLGVVSHAIATRPMLATCWGGA